MRPRTEGRARAGVLVTGTLLMTPGSRCQVDHAGGSSGGREPSGGDSPPLLALRSL